MAAGIHEVVVFHTSAEELLKHTADLPFTVIGDPHKKLYRQFGVEAGARALLNPRAWWPMVHGIAVSAGKLLRRRGAVPSLNPEGGRYGLPADFLIDQTGTIVACYYGTHSSDQWSVDELLGFAGSVARRPSTAE
ncbi:hypothetical protein GCM10023205_53890 [Yinghuangia aomiensis]|uniref:Redoxin domain-containing protein n=1 Tax=Yinghuangia aomiensis TaxID=676205 RepID=A0ABP9HUR7_9ACTN